MSYADLTVYDYAMEWAIVRGWSFRTSDTMQPGLIWMDSRRQIVVVHPSSSTVTLRMNTEDGVFPIYPVKPQ
jgi:hypothetical protein